MGVWRCKVSLRYGIRNNVGLYLCRQIWFAGNHADIGGAYRHNSAVLCIHRRASAPCNGTAAAFVLLSAYGKKAVQRQRERYSTGFTPVYSSPLKVNGRPTCGVLRAALRCS